MRTFLLLILAIATFFIWLNHNDNTSPAVANGNQPTPAVATTRPSAVSQHNWAKHSLDRAHEVADQVQKDRRDNEQP